MQKSLLKLGLLSITLGLFSFNSVAKDQSTVIIASPSTIQSLNPRTTSLNLDMGIARSFYEGLFTFDQHMKVIPQLAESYTISPDAKVYTIKLKSGIRFSDGTPFNADAVIFNFTDQITKKQNGSSLLGGVETFKALDEHTVQITLKKASNNFLNTLAHPAELIISPTALKKENNTLDAKPVGTGRYIVKNWVRGSKLSLIPNPQFHGEATKVQQVDVRPVPEAGSRLAMLKSGQAQFILRVPPIMKPAIDADKKLKTVMVSTNIVRYFEFNNENEILANADVRRAINFAIDKTNFNKIVYRNIAKIQESPLPQTIETFKAQTPYTYDVKKAKALLAKAGYPDGFKLSIWAKNASASTRTAEFMQQQLKKIGVTAEIVSRDVASHYAAARTMNSKDNHPAVLFDKSFSASTATADWSLRPLWMTDAVYNFGKYSNKEVDKLLVEGQRELDPAQKLATYEKIQKTLWDDAAGIWNVVDVQIYAQKKNLAGVSMLPDGSLSIGNVYYKK